MRGLRFESLKLAGSNHTQITEKAEKTEKKENTEKMKDTAPPERPQRRE